TEDTEIVPHYPRPVEFHVSRVAHVTTQHGLKGILDEGGFKGSGGGFMGPFVWWGLVIGPEEIARAEERYLDKIFPDHTYLEEMGADEEESEKEKKSQQPFLHYFTSSPVFRDESRYGNFRFSFSLEEVLQAYSTQFCDGKEPVLRVWKTSVYKQAIMYSVLVHGTDVDDFNRFPILGDNEEGVCAYHNGEIIWQAQAISESHKFRLREKRQERQCHAESVSVKVYYVWDHVALVFHMPLDENKQRLVLPFPQEKLIGCLTACGDDKPQYNQRILIGYDAAKRIVDEIKK
ncbi:uncharacterized protein LOC134442030, partial [Engraulis encrasicolus]|uniref:uncharacterized protein LOC134442030 n=1 Tax=Engraulis encrasicolus TaxID=184585 RepID=UPI002FCE74F0